MSKDQKDHLQSLLDVVLCEGLRISLTFRPFARFKVQQGILCGINSKLGKKKTPFTIQKSSLPGLGQWTKMKTFMNDVTKIG